MRQSILSPIYRSPTDATDFALKKWLLPKLTESRPLANGCLVNVWFSNPDDNPSMLRHGMVSKSHVSHNNKILISAFLCKLIHQHSSLKAYMIIIMLQYNSKSNFQNATKEAKWLYKRQYKQKVTHFYLESFKKAEFRTYFICCHTFFYKIQFPTSSHREPGLSLLALSGFDGLLTRK